MTSRRNSQDVKISPIAISAENGKAKSETRPESDTADLSSNSMQPRSIDLKGGVVMIISLMIGSGIFTSPGKLHSFINSSGWAMIIWLVSGMLALTGALCYAELGTAIPGSGGEAQYLDRSLGPLCTYLFDWTSILLLKPGSVAILLRACSLYAINLYKHLSTSTYFEEDENKLFYVKILSCIGCVVVTALSAYSHRWSNRILNVLTYSKILAIGFVIGGGLMYYTIIDPTIFKNNILQDPFKDTIVQNEEFTYLKFINNFVLALCQGLWSFEGWNNLNIVSGDLKNPKKNLPLAIWISVGLVLVLYLSALLGYYCVITADAFIASDAVGLVFGQNIAKAFFGAEYGWIGAVILSVCIMGSAFSAALSSMITSTEIIVLSANNGNIPALFGIIDSVTKTALNAYLLQGVLSVLLAVVFTNDLMTIYTFPTWIFYTLCAIVLVRLRFTDPELERPYKVWITTPILFLIACAIIIFSLSYGEFWNIFYSFAVILLGIPVYFWFNSRREKTVKLAN